MTETTHAGIRLRSLDAWEGYWAGYDGHIYFKTKEGFRRLRPMSHKKFRGLRTVTLYRDDRRYWRKMDSGKMSYVKKPCPRYLHRLIADAWLPPKPSPTHEIDHEDEDRGNNAPTNLRWMTKYENSATWRANHPDFQGMAKLTPALVGAIRALRGRMTAREVGEEYGVSRRTVYLIWWRRSWKHVS